MFAWTYRKELLFRVSLIVMVLVNAVVPTAALASATNVGDEAAAVALIPPSSTPPVQPKIYYTPEDNFSSSLNFSPEFKDEVPPAPEKDVVEFSVFASNGELPADRVLTLNVNIHSTAEIEILDLKYTDTIADLGDFISSKDDRVEYNPATKTVSFSIGWLDPGEEISFSYTVKVKGASTNVIAIHNANIEYLYAGTARSSSTSMGFAESSPFVDANTQILVPDSTGDGWNSSGQISLYLDKEALPQDAVVTIQPEKLAGEGPELQFNLDLLQIDTTDTTASGELREQMTDISAPIDSKFDTPVYLEINLDGIMDLTNLPADQEPFVATYDEESGVWVKVPIVLENLQTNSVVVEAAHFSTWGAGLGNSLPKNGANVLLFDQPYTSQFTGAARYSIPIWTPQGRAGMQPNISLAYSSATVDGVLGDVQAPWTGVGWNIDGIEIVRKITTNENGYGYVNDFALTLNGAIYKLIQDTTHPSRYYTDHDAFLYIELHNYKYDNTQDKDENYPENMTGEWWEVVTTDGTRYRLGWNKDSEQLALMYGYKCSTGGLSCQSPDSAAYASLGYAGLANNLVAMRWRVDRIQDTHGNYIAYSYKEFGPAGVGTIPPFDRESYINTIAYTGYENKEYPDRKKSPSYLVQFFYGTRPGDEPSTFFLWDNVDTKLLDKVKVCFISTTIATDCSGATNVRTYDFGYSVASAPNANGTLTLTSMDVTGFNGNVTTQAPTVRFTYENKANRAASGSNDVYAYPRLVKIDNGAGGVLTYTYETDGRDANSWYNYRINQVKVENGLGVSGLQSYTYATPVYAGLNGNVNYGDLIGYKTTTENQLDYENANAVLLSTAHTFGTSGLDTGRELKTEVLKGATIYRRTTNVYVTDNSKAPFDKWNFRYLYSSLNYELSGGSMVLTTKSIFKRDPATGNLLSQTQYLGSSVYRKTYYEYLVNSTPSVYILDTASRALVTDASNVIISDTRYHYDDRINMAPSRGDLTLIQKLTGFGNQTVDQRTHYNEYGNVDSVKVYSGYGETGKEPTATGFETITEYDSDLGIFPIRSINPLLQQTVTDYIPALGLPYRVTDPNGWQSVTTYDGLGRTLSVWAPGLNQPGVYYSYPEVDLSTGRIESPYSVEMQILDTAAAPNKYRSVWGIYDGLGRMLQTQVYNADNDMLVVTDSYFNAQGLNFKQSLPYEISASGGYYAILPTTGVQYNETTFDPLGRPLTVTQPGNIVTTTSYDGLVTTILDPNENKVIRTTDGLGRLISVKEFASAGSLYATTSYTYDSADRLVKVLDANSNETLLQYDWLGRKLWMNDPDMGVWEYEYNPVGTLTWQKDARGVEITFAYDALGRLISKTGTELNVNYQYGTTAGTIGMRIGMTDGTGTTTWNYSNFGRVVTEDRQINGNTSSMTTTSDWLGRPIFISYPDGEKINFKYDSLGRPDNLVSDSNTDVAIVDLAYNALGQIVLQDFGKISTATNSVVKVTNVYDDQNHRLISRTSSLDTSSNYQFLNYSYKYDFAGNLEEIIDGSLHETHAYSYDFLNRLTLAEAYTTENPSNYKYRQQFVYDPVGNMLQENSWITEGQSKLKEQPLNSNALVLYKHTGSFGPSNAVYVLDVDATDTPTEIPTNTNTPTSTSTPSAAPITPALTNSAMPPTASPLPTSLPTQAPWQGVDEYTTTLLHMDLVDGSQNFVDTSRKVWSAISTAALNTSAPKFGNACGLFAGSGITTPDSEDFYFSGDFTVDMWLKFSSLPAVGSSFDIYKQSDSESLIFSRTGTNTYYWQFRSGTKLLSVSTTAPALNTWMHVAAVRTGSTGMVFENGNLRGSSTLAYTPQNRTESFGIGGNFQGCIDEFRISKAARWTTNFELPTTPYDPGDTPTPTPTATSSPAPSTSLKAYWSFDNVVGTTVNDEASNDSINDTINLQNGPLVNGAGVDGTSVYLDATNDYASVSGSNEVNFNGSFTVSAWVKPETVVTDRTQYILQKGGTTYKDYGLITYSTYGTATPTGSTNVVVNGGIAFQIGDFTPSTVTGPVLSAGSWSHVVGVYDSSSQEMRLFVNGGLVASQKVTGALSMSSSALTLSMASTAYRYNGSIDEVRLYNRALSPNEISDLFTAFSAAVPTPTFTPTPTPIITMTATPVPGQDQQWGTGEDGDLIVGSETNTGAVFNLNEDSSSPMRACADAVAFNVTSLGSSAAVLDASPASDCFAENDEVLLIQLTDSSSTSYNAGSYEFLRVASVDENMVIFTSPKKYWYGYGWRSDLNIGKGSGQYRVMLIRVPNYHDVTIYGTLEVNSYNNNKYGVLAFRVNGTLSGNGTITTNGLGYPNSKGYGSPGQTGGGAGYGTAGLAGTGAGGTTYGMPDLSRIYLGSGGGGLNGNPGGSGGGIILISGHSIDFSGTITSAGMDGINAYGFPTGAGSGGSIRVEGDSIISIGTLSAQGGSVYAQGGKGRVAVYYQTSYSSIAANPAPYIGRIGQALTATPAPTAINLATPPVMSWGTGKDGTLTVNSGQTFNLSTTKANGLICPDGGDAVSYSVLELSDSSAKVSSAPGQHCLDIGDEVMLIHLNGSGPNTGNYEFLRVGGIQNDIVYFKEEKTLWYGSGIFDDLDIGTSTGQQRVALVRVPNYSTVSNNGTITVNTFDQNKSGVLLLRIADTLSGSGTITANALGFSGQTGYGPGSIGGSSVNQPGSGGGYGTSGTGTTWALGGSAYGIPNLSKLYFGSGGGHHGGYQTSETEWVTGGGGHGGGIVLIIAKTIDYSGTISSQGANGTNSANHVAGAGAGGSIRIEGDTISLGTVTAQGGALYAAGGDGRIAIYYQTSFSGNFTPGYIQQVTASSPLTATPTLSPAAISQDSYTVSLLHMDGIDASTQFVDSISPKIWTANGNAQIDVEQYKFNGASALYDGTGDYIFSADSNDWQLDSGSNANSWTIDAWVKLPSDPGATYQYGIVQQYVDGNNFWAISLYNNTLQFLVKSAGVGIVNIQNTFNPSANTWYHIAVVKNGTAGYMMFVNGYQIGNTQIDTSGIPNLAGTLRIGQYQMASVLKGFNGWIDEVHISKGIARWTSNFIPPTAPYQMSGVPTPSPSNTPTPTSGWTIRNFTYDSAHPHAVAAVTENSTPAANYTYDANGNMTCRVEDGVTYLHAYNTENRISSITRLASGDCATPGIFATKWDFGYDGDGVRVATLTTTYDANGAPDVSSWTAYYFGGAYEVRSDNTTIKYYSFAGQMVAMNDGNGLKYFLTDHLGSVVAITDATGTLISQQRYLPFGAERTDVSSPNAPSTDYGYTGQRDLDPGMGGLMDYKARFYSPYLNHFIQPDTLVPTPSNPQAWNRYSYVYGNPIRFTDPSGHACVEGTSYCVNSNTGQTSGSLTSYNDSSTLSARLDGKIEEDEEVSGCGYHHCEVETNLYEVGWENFGQAWDIWTNPNATYGQQWLAGAYMSYWGGAHVLFAIGAGGLICSGFATCLAAANSALGIGNTTCGGDACASEATVASSYANRVLLQKTLASQSQMGEVGFNARIIAQGSKINDVGRLVSTYGGEVSDWAKLSSSNFTTLSGQYLQTHWYVNPVINQIVEIKSKLFWP